MHSVTFPQCLKKVVFPLLEDLNVPRSLTVMLLIQHEEFGQLVNLTTDPALYLTADDYFRAAAATELLRKCADLPTGINTKKVAEDGFFTAEKQCYLSNLRLAPFLHGGPFETPGDMQIDDFLQSVKRRVRRILGPLPQELFAGGRFGPGATFNDRGTQTTVLHKLSSQPTATRAFSQSCFYGDWLSTFWSKSVRSAIDRPVMIIRGNRFTTVPKDATKDRGIAVEPSLNIFYQLSLGKAIRDRLRRCGVDLNDGQHIHREVARESSLTGASATIDLSSASDTVCRNLVQLLLPDDWFWALNTLRSQTTQLGGKTHYLEKFSSMGNGFTFELETLIFLSIACESCRRAGIFPTPGSNVYAYGDDIIVPSECVDILSGALRFCGFTLNQRKTFTSGCFRESCGGDFFSGEPVRAHYLKEYPHDPQQWISLANGLRRMAENYCRVGLSGSPFRRAWYRVLDNIPASIRGCRGPEELGDIVIHDSIEFWSIKVVNSIRFIRAYVPIVPLISFERFGSPVTQLAAALYGCPSDGVAIRGSVSGYRHKWVSFS